MKRALSRTVVILGLVSFLNDAASEMVTPLLPLFLTMTLGAGPAAVGLVEGVAEATASLLKLVAGRLADRGWDSKRLVLAGYGVSNTMRPLIGLAFTWGWVLLMRFLDRIGKGVRTAPRDALIAAAAPAQLRGTAFGFHRAMDNAGAVVGPVAAFFLLQSGTELRHVFLLSAVAGVLVLLLIAAVPRPAAIPRPQAPAPLRWRALAPRLRALIIAAGGLALATAPEVFLVLWARDHGLEIVWVPLLWAAASAVKAAIALPGGHWSDRLGRVPVLTAGWSARIVLLLALGLAAPHGWAIWLLFLAYAAGLAFTEGAERALIGDHAPADQKATAYGLYHMVSGLLALPGAVLFGALWEWGGKALAFCTAAALTGLSVAALLILAGGARRGRGA